MTFRAPRITFWRVVLVLILAAGAWATWIRFTQGLGGATHLSDDFPWGIWVGFDVLCGVMLAAGGFTLMAFVHIFHAERFKPVSRPALLTAYLGYLLVCAALMFDLGKPWNIWHPLVMWNPHSVMFEVGWCVMLYTTVLTLEFLPVVFERFRMERPLRIIHAISLPIVILGVLLSTLHQSSLGSLYLIMAGKLHPLWYSSLLPVFFFISAIAVGIAMTIFESTMSARHFGHQLQPSILARLGKILTVVLILYAVMRFQSLYRRDALKYIFDGSYEANLFLLEIATALIIPIILLLIPKFRENPKGLYLISILVVFGFVINRLNISITGMEGAAGVTYVPKWPEVAITMSIVAVGVTLFALAVKYLPIFSHEVGTVEEEPMVAGEPAVAQ
ncbi:MAG: Ni/Fe-hydrogenase cytochrome b subunit [Thermoanaerobaculia bacterium]